MTNYQLEIENILLQHGQRVVKQMIEVLQDTQRLKHLLIPTITYEKNSPTLTILMPSYAPFVENGRAPNSKQPPISAISKWIKQKGIEVYKTKLGKPMSLQSQSFIIARSIARNGIKPRPFMHFINENTGIMMQQLGDVYRRQAADKVREAAAKNNLK
jgi:hypothetical protein